MEVCFAIFTFHSMSNGGKDVDMMDLRDWQSSRKNDREEKQEPPAFRITRPRVFVYVRRVLIHTQRGGSITISMA